MDAADPAQVLDALHWRYATKEFDPQRTIPPATWAALLDSLVLAPSSFGLQPWRFLVVDDRELRERLRGHSWNQGQVTEADRLVVLCARTDVTEAEIDRWIRCLAAARGTAPESLAGLQRLMVGFAAGMDAPARHAWCVRQVYIALGQLMACAAMLGVDSCPLEGLDPAAYDRELGLDGSGFATVVACALGYRSPADKYAAMPKVRYPAAEVVRVL